MSILIDNLAGENIGIYMFVSYGNAVDITESDLIEYLSADKSTDIIVGYIEGIKDGRRFINVCRNSAKPIVLLKAGRHSEISSAVKSHTGSLAGSYEVYSGVAQQLGVGIAEDWESLLDVAKAYLQPIPKGRKVFVVTDGGGFGILAADSAVENKLTLTQPSKSIIKKLNNMPEYAILKNPLDVTGDATVERYKSVLETALKSKEFDSIVVIALWQIPTLETTLVDEIAKLNKKFKTPIYIVAPGSDYAQKINVEFEKHNIPVYPTPDRAMSAISKILDSTKQF